MSTHSSAFRRIIFESLSQAPKSVKELYEEAKRKLKFDSEDLTPPRLKGRYTSELSWQRNLRNVLQSCKNSGTLVNSPKDYWRLPTPNPELHISDNAWDLIKENAKRSYKSNESWFSIVQNHEYKISEIADAKLKIERLEPKAKTPAILHQNDVKRAIIAINAGGGCLSKSTMNYVVAKETAIVHLHPNLQWDDEGNIRVINTNHPDFSTASKIVYKEFGEAPDDDPNQIQVFARRVRKGQTRLRKKLLSVYEEKCCISKTGPVNVLEVAHIEAHSITGNNKSTNNLLLRADFHCLYDDDLLFIDPETLVIKVDPILKDTEYYKYNNTKLLERRDGLRPDKTKLKSKWDKLGSIK